MLTKTDVEKMALELFSFLTDSYRFQKPLINSSNFQARISYLAENIGIELELDWREMSVFVLIVRLESGKLPNGYYVSESDRKVCRIHLQRVLYNLGYRDEEINTKGFYKKRKKREFPSFEGMKSMLEKESALLKKTIDLIIIKQESLFTQSTI
jgi:hypothetical protein